MTEITTTMSFRAAWRFGVPHLAGHGVRLVRRAGVVGMDVFLVEGGARIGSVYFARSLRERGGVLREAELSYPQRVSWGVL